MRRQWQYRADTPPDSTPPTKWRSNRKVAAMDLRLGLRNHMIAKGRDGVGWALWAFSLGAGLTKGSAPDDTDWQIVRREKPDE